MSGNTNPGNFANRPKEEVSSIAQKGGEASHNGGFASMDPDKQVSMSFRPAIMTGLGTLKVILQKEIASMGGKASSGSFEPGSEKAKEAGAKGGSKS